MTNKKPAGYYQYVLSIDSETTGLHMGTAANPCVNEFGEYYQAVSWGLVIADMETLKPIDSLYVEVQWDGKSIWSPQAEKVHGLSKEYLAQHGVTSEEAVIQICSFILKYYGPDSVIRLLGYNVATFDLPFLRHLLEQHGIVLKFGNRHIDLGSVGTVLLETYTSDQFFDKLNFPPRDPSKHNSLEDAKMTLEAARRIRAVFKNALGK